MKLPAIELELISKQFGGLLAVDAVSLMVANGERRVLIGPNGAGKTTLFHCISGTLQPSSGCVKLFGGDVTKLTENRRTELGMGRTFQISNVFTELSLLENVVLALMGTVSRKWTVHRSVGHYPELRSRALDGLERVGLKARADDSVNDLSYGDRRQLEMALALNTNPKILLLDEPCAGLSPIERQGIAKMISTLPRDITLIMIEHDMDIALALADSVTVLHRGKIIVEGSPAEVQANSEVRDVYFGNI